MKPHVRLLRYDRPDAPANELAVAHLRVTVKDPDERKVGRAFSDAITELALAGYAGFHATTPPTGASAYGVYWPALIPARLVTQQVHLPDGSTVAVRHHDHDPRPRGQAEPGAGPQPAAPASHHHPARRGERLRVDWPALIPERLVTQQVHLPDGSTVAVRHHHHDPRPGQRSKP